MDSSRNLVQNLSASHIVALVFFALCILGIMISTIIFFVYRFRIKNLSEIDQLLEIVNRFPIDKMISRLEVVNKINDGLIVQEVDALIGQYLAIFSDEIIPLTQQFSQMLDSKKAYKLDFHSTKTIRKIKKDFSYVKLKLDSLSSNALKLLEPEFALRNQAINLHEQINILRNHEHKQRQEVNLLFLVNEGFVTDKFEEIYRFLTTFEKEIKLGNYKKSSASLKEMVRLIHNLDYVTTFYPLIKDYLISQYHQELNEILEAADFHEHLSEENDPMKKSRDHWNTSVALIEDELANEQVKSAYSQTQVLIREIKEYKDNLLYERRIKLFFSEQAENLKSLVSQLSQVISANQPNKNWGRKNPQVLKLTDDINQLDQALVNLDKNKKVQVQKEHIATFLANIFQTLDELLSSSNPTSATNEKNYLKILSLNFEIKKDLLLCQRLVFDEEWMVSEEKEEFTKEIMDAWDLYHKIDYLGLEDFVYHQEEDFDRVLEREKQILFNVNKLTSKIKYYYCLYKLASMIIVFVEPRTKENHEIIKLSLNLIDYYDAHDYGEVVDTFIRERKLF